MEAPADGIGPLRTTSIIDAGLRMQGITEPTLVNPALGNPSSSRSFYDWTSPSAQLRSLGGTIMLESELKKRQVSKASMSDMNIPADQSKAKAQTVTWKEISEWQLDNKYLLSGYRLEKADYLEIFTSLTFLHNETCNVYTHLVGALLLPLVATTFSRYLGKPQFLNVSSMDYAMFGIYFWCAEICLVLSALYHLLLSHSYRVEQFWHGMDLLGIVIVTIGTFSSGIYYVFYCEASLQKVHWAIILTTGTVTGVLISNPSLRTLRWRKVKVGAFIVFGASSFIPLLHGVQRYGLNYMLQYSGMKWYLLELAFYGTGVSLYAFRIPERLAPGKFDICGSSHQIFHVAILCAIFKALAQQTEAALKGVTALTLE